MTPLAARKSASDHAFSTVEGRRRLGAPDSLLTTVKCRRMGSWADVCVYENTCWDGQYWYFFEEGGLKDWQAENVDNVKVADDDMVRAAQSSLPCESCRFIDFISFRDCLQLEGLMLPVKPVPPTAGAYFPFNGGKAPRPLLVSLINEQE